MRRLRFGLEGKEPLTLKQIGHEIGLTRERVRQIEVEALRKLNQRLADDKPCRVVRNGEAPAAEPVDEDSRPRRRRTPRNRPAAGLASNGEAAHAPLELGPPDDLAQAG